MKTRITLSILAFVAYLAAINLWGVFKASVEASAAVAQAKDSIIGYTFGQQMAQGNLVSSVLAVLFLLAIVLLWVRPVMKVLRSKGNGVTPLLGLLIVVGALSTSGCMGPAKVLPLEKVGPNETAFLIPMEGATSNQAKFESVDFLSAHKVMSKQIEIPVRERSLGRMWYDYEYIPTMRVIKVDRQLVTREWTKGGTSGTSSKDEALSCASLDGINFDLGVNLTASILEEDASTYLYWHGQKPLSDVVDSNVRGYLQGIMSDEFGRLPFEQCKLKKADVFKRANDETIAKFKKVGINISYVGSTQGFMFKDSAIQEKINEIQTAQMAREVAANLAAAQVETNKQIVSKATAERQAAEQFAQAAAAQTQRIGLDIQMKYADAALEAAKRYKGDVPGGVVPSGSNFLFGLDRPAPAK